MQTQSIHKQPDTLTNTPTLLSSSINNHLIMYLYRKNFLTLEGLYFSWKLLNRHYHIQYYLEKLYTYLGGAMLSCGMILLLALQWHILPAFFQIAGIVLLTVGGLLGSWVYAFKHPKAILLLSLTLILVMVSIVQFLSLGTIL